MPQPPATFETTTHPAVWFAPVAVLILALFPMPYGFYTLMRFVVCGAAVVLAYQEYQRVQVLSGWIAAFSFIALLFNPLAPVHLSRAIWSPIDVAVAIFFLAHWRWLRVRRVAK